MACEEQALRVTYIKRSLLKFFWMIYPFCIVGQLAHAQQQDIPTQSAQPSHLKRFELSIPSMGSNLDMVVYAATPEEAQRFIDAGLEEVERLSLILSNYSEDSEISKLCRTPAHTDTQVSRDLGDVLEHSKRWYEISRGKFDITIGPLIQVWRVGRKERRLPMETEVQNAKELCGWEHVAIARSSSGNNHDESVSTVQLAKAGMRIDLSGIATGYIVDKAFEKMQAMGAESILINAGGDIRVGAPPPSKSGWNIAVAGLGKSSPPLMKLMLSNCAITTSGDLNQYLEVDGRRYSHLIDPHSGAPIERRQSVTVIASTTVDADAGATALAVLGIQEASQVFDVLPVKEAIMVEQQGARSEPIRFRHLQK